MQIKRLTIFDNDTPLVDINLKVENSLALVGQSGSGKSLTLKSLLGLLPSNLKHERDIEADFPLINGKTVAFVPQNAFSAFSPLSKIRQHFFIDEAKISRLFALLKLDIALLDRYANELSGGQLQRIVLALALESDDVKLLLLDEPTTALDAASIDDILQLIRHVQKELGFKLIFVTHDITVAKRLCHEIVVLKSGKVVESGKLEAVYNSPKSAYTKLLIESNFASREYRV